MAKFLMLGKYSLEGIKGITAERTKKVIDIVKESGGKIDLMYALLGSYDIAFAVDFAGHAEVIKVSVTLAKLTGMTFTTFPAFSVDEFDQILK